jgi:ankyrin repeat protein
LLTEIPNSKSLYTFVYILKYMHCDPKIILRNCFVSVSGIIQHGQCDILEVSAERNTVLHVAAEQGHDELIRELHLRFREEQGLLSRRNSALDTPLHCAARAGHVRAVAILVQLAHDCGDGESKNIVGCKNEAGDTALHLAARHGHGDAVEVLVLAAADPAAELNNAGVSPLYLAVMSGSVQAVRAIVSSCSGASAVGPSSQNALHAAVFKNSGQFSFNSY